MFASLQATFSGMPLAHRAVIGLVTLATLVGIVALTRVATQPTYAPLFAELDAQDAQAIVSHLRDQNIPYRLRNGGAAIEVAADKVDEVRMELAAKQLPTGGSASLSRIGSNPLMSNPFIQGIQERLGLAGDLEDSLETLDGVMDVKVILSLPKRELFREDQIDPSASVSVKFVPGYTPTARQRSSIVHLVYSAIPGMKPENVVVVDRDGGGVLNGQASGGGATQTDQLAFQDEYERRMERQLVSLVEGAIGPGKVRLRVSADIDYDEVVTEVLTHTPAGASGAPVVREETTSTSTYSGDAGNTAGGAPGMASNMGAAGASAPADAENYTTETLKRTNAVDESRTTTKKAPGRIKRLSVAAFVDEEVPSADVTKIKSVLEAAAGLDIRPEADGGRGDVIQVMPLAFVKPDTADADKAAQAAVAARQTNDYIRLGASGLIMVIFAVIVMMALRRRPTVVAPMLPAATASGSPAGGPAASVTEVPMGGQSGSAPSVAAAAAGSSSVVVDHGAVAAEAIDLTLPPESQNEAYARAMAEGRPEEVAKLIRSWMSET